MTIAAAAMLRAWLSWYDQSVFWPDEIHQSLEQAHRAVFGYGLVSWEFRDGARSWFFPGSIAAIWQVAAWLGVDSSLTLVMLAKLFMVGGSLLAIVFAAKLAADSHGMRAGAAVAVILATMPAAVVFSYRGMSETASAPLIVLGAWFLSKRSPRVAAYGALAIATACLFRYQNVLFVLVFIGTMLLQRRWRDALIFSVTGAAVAVLGGLLDWATWGRPFNSLIAYFDFNLLRNGASVFGVEPFGYYAATLWSSTGPLLLVLVVCFCVGALVEPILGGAVLTFVLAHCVLPHKEYRFLVPCLPLFATVAGIGFDRLLQMLPAPRVLAPLSAVVLTGAFAFNLIHLQYIDMGQYRGTDRAALSVWKNEEEPTLLLADVGAEPDVCGLTVLGARAAFTGGYTYLHRDVPLIYENRLCSTATANYVITPVETGKAELPGSYVLERQRGSWGIFRRAGVCQPPKDFDGLLEGAHDMGINLQSARQASDGSLRFDLAREGGSFRHGWGNGELIECDPARWVTSKEASVAFAFNPAGRQYQLRLLARGHEGIIKQRFAIIVNGVRVHVGAMSHQLKSYSVDLPENALRAGENRIDLAFGQTVRASSDDNRQLAALFRALEILPQDDDFVIDVALTEAKSHLVSGFQAREMAGDATFVWSDGPASEIEGTLASPKMPYILETFAEAVPLAPSQRTQVFANDQLVGMLSFPQRWARQRLAIPAAVLLKGKNRIRFEYETAVSPASLDEKALDTRELAVRFRRIELAPLPPAQDLDLGVAGARPYLLEGWSGDEREGGRTVVWTDGERASAIISFKNLTRPVLRLIARGYARAFPISVEVSVDGRRVGSFVAPDAWEDVAIPLPDGDYAGGAKVVSFSFNRTVRVADINSSSHDQRRLAMRVDRIWSESEGDSDGVGTALTTLKAAAR
jgi:hypothetical protein